VFFGGDLVNIVSLVSEKILFLFVCLFLVCFLFFCFCFFFFFFFFFFYLLSFLFFILLLEYLNCVFKESNLKIIDKCCE